MANISLSQSPLRPSASLTHQLATSCLTSVGQLLRVQVKPDMQAFCFKDVRRSYNVSMPHCIMTVYQQMTALTEWLYYIWYFLQFLNLTRSIRRQWRTGKQAAQHYKELLSQRHHTEWFFQMTSNSNTSPGFLPEYYWQFSTTHNISFILLLSAYFYPPICVC